MKDVDRLTLEECLAQIEAANRLEERQFNKDRVLFHSIVQTLSPKTVRFDRYLTNKKVERPKFSEDQLNLVDKVLTKANADRRNKV